MIVNALTERKKTWLPALAGLLCAAALAGAQTAVPDSPPERIYVPKGNFTGQTERPLRYWPVGTDFVITNGAESFNRPLYCLNSAFRIDGGDVPEFSLYLPGRGGNLRFGIQTSAGTKWLNAAQQVVARYRPGSMLYEIRDPLLGAGRLTLDVLPSASAKGLVARAELSETDSPVQLVWAFGGANGKRGSRGGDIGCESLPVNEYFQLRPEQCRDNRFAIASNTFVLIAKSATIAGAASAGASFAIADASQWNDLKSLLASIGQTSELPVAVGQIHLSDGQPVYLALTQAGDNAAVSRAEDLPGIFADAEKRRSAIAGQVAVETPDAFINAAAAALNIAADAVWDAQQQSFMHGAVAWRTRLLGWRGQYAGDALGWHDRTREHFEGFAKGQNTEPVPETFPPADASANLSRNEAALHSNGDLMNRSHYDMNLVAVDAFFRGLLWTGDTNYARAMWPVIQRHLAWEKRLFRREFGPDKLPLYEAYAAIWASDDLAYNGGGAAHASAYNYWHNQMAARVARCLGEDAAPYEREAELIRQGMEKYLWLADEGVFAEWRDLLGLQLAHPNPALWTFYHTLDSEAATPQEAWQMARFVDTQIAHIPVHGRDVPAGNYFTLPTTSWMPYTWSLNNVVMAEAAHTSLAFWQANRPETAFDLFKGCVLDSMYLGLCPGNLGMTTGFDMARGEAQRDFADAAGTVSRALVEGLFGIQPDALAGELKIVPGFPADWEHAAIRHPDLNFSFQRDGPKETFTIEPKFPKPMALRLQLPARRSEIESVTVNGQPAQWRALTDAVGLARIEIATPAAERFEVVVVWRGEKLSAPVSLPAVAQGANVNVAFTAPVSTVADPQQVLDKIVANERGFSGLASGNLGQHTVFAQLHQGRMQWWQPVMLEIRATNPPPPVMDWHAPLPPGARFETVDLSTQFNDRVTQIFRNEYLAPRSPFCSLATPAQGIGSWCHPNDQFVVDDSGLRAAAGKNAGKILLPNGVPLATPDASDAKNIVFTSQWTNYPATVSLPLAGKASHLYLLMAGSTTAMQSQFDNGEVVVAYADGSRARLALRNPATWWPIDQDYFVDDFAFRYDGALPPRVDLKTGKVRLPGMETFKGKGGKIPGGAATVLELPLDPAKELKSLSVRALANEVVIGLMGATLQR